MQQRAMSPFCENERKTFMHMVERYAVLQEMLKLYASQLYYLNYSPFL